MKPIVIVGAGHAGLTLARELRQHDKDIPIMIIAKDTVEAYYKPNLSKALSMNKSAEDLVMKDRDTLSQELNLDILDHWQVERIDAQNKEIEIRNAHNLRSHVQYTDLVLATGASPIRIPLKGSAADQVLSVNTLEQYRLFRRKLETSQRVVIMGAGFVGIEFASDLAANGYKVDVVDLGDWPLQRSLPKQVGSAIKNAFPEDKTTWHLGTRVETVSYREDGLEIQLNNGNSIFADVVLSAVGIKPNTTLAKEAGILTNSGIVVDEYMQTNHEHIYALGDCCEVEGRVLPFIAPTTAAAKSLAKTLSGERAAISLTHLPVAVKIAFCPTIISTQPFPSGTWQTEGQGKNWIARYRDEAKNLCGFALTGDKVNQKGAISAELYARNVL